MTHHDYSDRVCQTCKGKGALLPTKNRMYTIPAYWFEDGAKTCHDCDGTGENQ